jgi:hypothetical protein
MDLNIFYYAHNSKKNTVEICLSLGAFSEIIDIMAISSEITVPHTPTFL